MSNTYFRFKQFTVHHDRCAMKVGTDGVLLGATAYGGRRILDIGTGTGLVAMMMAQRFPLSMVTAIDIDKMAVEQAKENVEASPFRDRIEIVNDDISNYCKEKEFDCIVCNPPFFEDSLRCPNEQRATARHAEALPFDVLIDRIAHLLSAEGIATIIIPSDIMSRIESECAYANLFIRRKIFIRTVERKMPKRVLVSFGKQRTETEVCTQCLMEHGERSAWYNEVCKDFYL